MGSLITFLFYIYYQKDLEHFEKELFYKMNICADSLTCNEFDYDFVKKEKGEKLTHVLYKAEKEIGSFYQIKEAGDYYLKVSYDYEVYSRQLHQLFISLLKYFLFTLSAVLILSIIFSLYSLYPLRNALLLTKEFVRDILHDFNTPISTMRLNLSLLDKEVGSNIKIERIERSIDNILLLQKNLKHYLLEKKADIEPINLHNLVTEQIYIIEKNYTHLEYIVDIDMSEFFETDKEAFVRILSNILSNASKYNKKNGKVIVAYQKRSRVLTISDTGKGIKNPKQVFDRFYKEQKEGVGIGLHIVKKLCDQLHIKLLVKSKLNEGTTLSLYL